MPTNLPDFRMIIGDVRARRTRTVWQKAKGNSLAAKQGLRYENRVAKELKFHETRRNFIRVEHNPWFSFVDDLGSGNCSPDFLLWLEDNKVIVVEVKLTWVEVAAHKLTDLYYPVLRAALDAIVEPLVICRHLTPNSPPAKHTLREAIASDFRLMNWPDNGRMLW